MFLRVKQLTFSLVYCSHFSESRAESFLATAWAQY